MLKQRVLTALILAPLVLGAIYFLPSPIVAIILGLIILIGAWEWAGLSGFEATRSKAMYVGTTGLLILASYPLILKATMGQILIAACLWWLVALIVIISAQVKGALPQQNRWLFLNLGYLILIPAWMAIVFLHSHTKLGPVWVLFLFALIWTADIGAYFAGRAIGKHKLADKISPGKSWEGVFGGLIAVLVLAMLLLPVLTDKEEVSTSMILLCLGTVLISVLGDLTESVVKRISGKKDSGTILPGHGGVMDRIDSLTAAAPIFVAGLILLGYVSL